MGSQEGYGSGMRAGMRTELVVAVVETSFSFTVCLSVSLLAVDEDSNGQSGTNMAREQQKNKKLKEVGTVTQTQTYLVRDNKTT